MNKQTNVNYEIVKREEAILRYFKGEEVLLIDVDSATVSDIEDLYVSDLTDDNVTIYIIRKSEGK